MTNFKDMYNNHAKNRQQCRKIIGKLNNKSPDRFSVFRYYDNEPDSPTHFMDNKIIFQVDGETVAMHKTWKEMLNYLTQYYRNMEKE